MSIFKAYDVRGVVPSELAPDAAYCIGRAAARVLAAKCIAVGRDARASSPALSDALLRGLCEEGVDVVDLGLVSTPMLYFAVEHLAAGGGIMVTASHNPAQYNGFKICREHAIPVGGASGLAEIGKLASRLESSAGSHARGSVTQRDLRAAYVEQVRVLAPAECPPLRVAIDCGNGMGSVGLEPLLERLPLAVERLYFEPDGTFPNHEADPLKTENLKDLIAAVRRHRADLGVAFDGDGDRAVFVDERGVPVPSDRITALLAQALLRGGCRGRAPDGA